MNKFFLAAVSALLAGTLCGCEPTFQRRVLEYEMRVNARDAKGVASLFADDATFRHRGKFSLEGKEALYKLAQWDSVLHTHLTFHDMVTEGDTVIATLEESNDWLAALGIEFLIHPSTLVIYRDGLISSFETETDSAGTNAIRRSLDALLEWGVSEHPNSVQQLTSGKGTLYDAENAQRWMRLIKQWKASFETEP